MVDLIALIPPAALFGGALASAPVPSAKWRPSRELAVIGAIIATLGSIALLAVTLQDTSEPTVLRLILSPWSTAAFRAAPAVYVDVTAAFCVLLVSGAALVGVLRGLETDRATSLAGPLAVSAAAALFVSSASTPLGLVVSWLAVDLTLFFGAKGGRRALVAGQMGLLMAIAGLVALPFETTGGGAAASLTSVPASSRIWLSAAAAMRMGLYPLWWAVPRSRGSSLWMASSTRLAPTIAGLFLFLRLAEQTGLGQGLNTRALAPAMVALLFGAALAWLSANRAESFDWQTTYHASLVVMAASLGGAIGRGIAMVLLLDLVLVRVGMYSCDSIAERRLVRVSRWVIAAAAVALPPTLGFAGRWLLYRELYAFRLYGVLAVCVVASMLATGALIDAHRSRSPARRRGIAAAAAITVVAAIELVGGIWFGALDPLLSSAVGQTLPSALGDMWNTLTSPITIADGLLLLSAIVVPVVLAYLLRRSQPPMGAGRRRVLRRALRLTLVVEGAVRVLVRSGEVAQRSTGLLESRRAMAWTLMAVIVTGGAIVVAATTDVGEPHTPSVPAVVMFAIAAALSVLLVLRRSPAATLSALAASYIVAGAVLIAADTQPVIAITKVVVGALVVSILAISVAQGIGTADQRTPARLMLARPSPVSGATLSMLGVAAVLFAGLVMSLGVYSEAIVRLVPDALLHPALALVVGGVVAAVFARSPLRLAGGVLFALVGAELISTSLDAGLIITGGLGAFQLLVAVVASYYVGEHVAQGHSG